MSIRITFGVVFENVEHFICRDLAAIFIQKLLDCFFLIVEVPNIRRILIQTDCENRYSYR